MTAPALRCPRARWLRRRRAVFLHRAGLTPAEIGPRLGMAPAAVRWLLWREGERPHRRPAAGCPVVAALMAAPVPLTAAQLAAALAPERYAPTLRRVRAALARAAARGRVVRLGRPPFSRACRALWTPRENLPMTVSAAQELLRRGVPFGDVAPHVPPADLEGLRAWFCAEPGLPNLEGRAALPPKAHAPDPRALGYTGNSCPRCQSVRMVRAGACERCEDCGDTTSCG